MALRKKLVSVLASAALILLAGSLGAQQSDNQSDPRQLVTMPPMQVTGACVAYHAAYRTH